MDLKELLKEGGAIWNLWKHRKLGGCYNTRLSWKKTRKYLLKGRCMCPFIDCRDMGMCYARSIGACLACRPTIGELRETLEKGDI